ncbi:MAG: hypothetical protein PHP44_00265 [Kiritimatiellae bacterium]|nr:hypothetical protein [Kiritimatiellia bacterium]MDD4734517.1 hypothetical protein [Kiritimatiellia bacterium]
MTFDASIEHLADWIDEAASIVVLTGAGISVPSGIPDFRSAGGLYSLEQNRNVFDLDAFREDPTWYYRFAREFYPLVWSAVPNIAHRMTAGWERGGRKVEVVTQNVDDLHQRAGSSSVYPLHGDMMQSTCLRCGRQTEAMSLNEVIRRGEVPHCTCGGVYKPNITFFGRFDSCLRGLTGPGRDSSLTSNREMQ